MQNGSLLLFFFVILLSYLIFVFVSGKVNPFAKTKKHKRGNSRRRFARYMAILFIVCSCLGMLTAELLPISRVVTLGISTVGFGVLWLFMSIGRYFRRSRARQVSIEHHEIELELANAPIAPNFVNFDQFIVETAFQSLRATDEFYDDFSSPDYANAKYGTVGFRHSDFSEQKKQDKPEASTYVQDTLTEISDDSPNKLSANDLDGNVSYENVQRLNQKTVQLDMLLDKNQELEVANDKLTIEVAKFRLVSKNSQAIVQKNKVEIDHALLLKDQALQLAALERKKRRIIEVKAHKVTMKLRQNMLLLEAESPS